MDGVSRGRAGTRRAYAGGRRWALLAVMALLFGVSTAGAQGTPAPMIRRIIGWSIQGSTAIVTIAAGSSNGVQRNWKVWLLRGDSEEPLPGDEVQVIRIDKSVTVGKVRSAIDRSTATRVLLRP